MNKIQSKYHKIKTYEINKISLPCFGDKIYIQKLLVNRVNYKNKTVILTII